MSRSEAYYGLSWRLTHLCPVAHPDGHDGPGLVGELVPGIAAVIDDTAMNKETGERRRRTITLHHGRLGGLVGTGNRLPVVELSDVG